MNFNNVFLPQIETSDQQCLPDALALDPVPKFRNPDADLSIIDHQVDDLSTKVDKAEVELKEVEEFYSNVVKNVGRESSTPSSTKKNQTRAVAAKRRQELKMRQDKGSGDHEPEAQPEMQLAQEIAHARTARKISNELHDIDRHLEELRGIVLQKCRKFSVDEKRKLSAAFTKLSPEHLIKALEIVAQSNPNFTGAADEVDLDMDNLSESTLWKLKIFVKGALKTQGSPPTAQVVVKEDDKNINNKRKKKICDALAKTKRTKVEVMDK